MVDTFIRESPSGPLVSVGGGGETAVTLVSVRYVDPATPLDPVDQTGSDEAPFATLQQAIDSIGADDLTNATVFMVDGDYGSLGAEYAPLDGDILQIVGFGSAQNVGELVIVPGSGASRLIIQNLSISPSAFAFESNASGGTYELWNTAIVGDLSAPGSALRLETVDMTGDIVDVANLTIRNTLITGNVTFTSGIVGFNSVLTGDGNIDCLSSAEANVTLVLTNVAGIANLPDATGSISLDDSTISSGTEFPNGSLSLNNGSRASETVNVGSLGTIDSNLGNVTADSIESTGSTFGTATVASQSNFLDSNVNTSLTSAAHLLINGGLFGTVTAPSIRANAATFDNVVANFDNTVVSDFIGCRILTSTITNGRIEGGVMLGSNAVAAVELLCVGVTFPDGGDGIAADTLTMIGCAIGCSISAADGSLIGCHWIDGTHNISGTTADEWRFENTYVPADMTFGMSNIAALTIDTESYYAGIDVGVFGDGGTAPPITALEYIDPPYSATISITVPAVADGAVGYATTSLVGTPLEGVFTAANQPVLVNPQGNLVGAGAGGGFINARIGAANSLVTAYLGALAGGAANFTVTRVR